MQRKWLSIGCCLVILLSGCSATPETDSTEKSPTQETISNEETLSVTGTKYHATPHCSKMKHPVALSIEDAQAQGYEPCQKCWSEE